MPRSREVVSADALIQIASDPKRYEEMLKEFSARQGDAVVAEGKARDATTTAEAAQVRAKAAEARVSEISADMNKREAALRDRNEAFEDGLAKLKMASNTCTERERVVGEREDALAGLHADALDAVSALVRGVAR